MGAPSCSCSAILKPAARCSSLHTPNSEDHVGNLHTSHLGAALAVGCEWIGRLTGVRTKAGI